MNLGCQHLIWPSAPPGISLDRAARAVDNIRTMKAEDLLERLEETARRLSIRVEYDDLHRGEVRTSGGIFSLRGENRILIHRRLRPSERAEVLLDILAGLDTEGVHLPEAVRKRLEARRRKAP